MLRLHVRYLPLWIVLFFTFSLSMISTPPVVQAATDTTSFVTRSGTKFYLNGREFKFVGFNLFDAAATDRYKCAWWARFSDSELDATLKYMRSTAGATVLRFWAFQNYTKGGTDWTGMDRVIRIAKQNGFKLLPVLENGPTACTGSPTMEKWQYSGDTWYTSGYKLRLGTDAMSYRDYVRTIVTRYKDEPAIMGWVLMNDPNTGKRDAAGKTVLISFAKDVGGLIKSIDTKHLVTLGGQSNGATGTTGKDFVDVYSLPEMDFTTGTDRAYWIGQENDPLPGSTNGTTLPSVTSPDCVKTYQAKVACALANAMQVVKKPFVMMDAGIKVENNPTSRQTRANVMGSKMSAMFSNGASGYMLWHWNKMIDDQKYDIIQSQADPLLAKMKTFAGILPTIDSPSVAGKPPAPLSSGSNTTVVRGVNLMGGWQSLYGSSDNFATTQQLDYYKSKGLNTFRVGFLWDKLQPTLRGPLDATYLAKMDKLVADARARGQKITFVPLPGKWKGNDVGTAAVPQDAFNDLWIKLATKYKGESAIWGYSLINEPGMGDVWNISIAPGAIAAIRTVDMVKPIIVPTSTGGYAHNHKYHLIGLPMQDPANNLIYEAHVYFDSPPDGVYNDGFDVPNANLNIGIDRAKDFVQWCVSNNQKCYFGEYGIPAGWSMGTPTCSFLGGTNKDTRWLTILDNFMAYLDQNKISGTYWAGGPYGDVNSAGPFCDTAGKMIDGPQMPILLKHLGTGAVPSAMTMSIQAEGNAVAMAAEPTMTATATVDPMATLTVTGTVDAALTVESTLEVTAEAPTLTSTAVPSQTPTYLPSATPALIPSATITETPIVIPTVVAPTAAPVIPTQAVVIIDSTPAVSLPTTEPAVIIIGGGQATPVVSAPTTEPSIIIIGQPTASVPTSEPIVIIPPTQPVVATPIPVVDPVIVIPTAAPVVPTLAPGISGVAGFMLVNAETGLDIMTIGNGMTIDMATLPTRKITVRAHTQGTIGSVVFGLDANPNYRVENGAPYALYNDSVTIAWPYTLGQHTVTATAYSSAGGSGTLLGALSVQFTLVDTVAK